MSGPVSSSRQTIADRLASARHRRFVGRDAERDLFRAALLSPEPPFTVLFIYGPGGVGKSSLLAEYARMAGDAGVRVVCLDARNVEPAPAGLLQGLREAMGLHTGISPAEALTGPGRSALFIDTYELIGSLDGWLRESFLPSLPESTMVVLAGRQRPAPAWRADAGWADLTRIVSLRNLRTDEALAYLHARGVPEERHHELIKASYGHPLALSLFADLIAQGEKNRLPGLDEDPDLIKVLLERFVEQIPDETHRRALEICAHVRVTSESFLEEALGVSNAREMFAWLRGLSFIQEGQEGLFPHDLARDVLDADLRWRNPERYKEMHARVRKPIIRLIETGTGRTQQQAAVDLLYLHRNGPVMRQFHDWETLGTGYAEPMTADDVDAVLEMVRRHEGPESAAIAAYWLDRRACQVKVFRDAGGMTIGFMASLMLTERVEEDCSVDPAVRAAWDYVDQAGPLRPGEILHYHRILMGAETYQDVSTASNLWAMQSVIEMVSTPKLAWTFIATSAGGGWGRAMTYLNMRPTPEASFSVGHRTFEVFAHDWREQPTTAWLTMMGEREIATEVPPPPEATTAALLVLSRSAFDEAVRDLLKNLTRPDALEGNPLLRSRLAFEAAGDEPPIPSTLVHLVREAAESLRGNPRDEKLYRAVYRTYLEPAAAQELAAEALGLPFSTYRYHLSGGVKRIADWLWEREIAN